MRILDPVCQVVLTGAADYFAANLFVDADQVTEALCEARHVHVGSASQASHELRILKIALLQADHISASALIGLAANIYFSGLHPTGRGIDELVKRKRLH